MKRTNTVIFDLDGTLLDTLGDLQNALNHTLREFGMPERTLDETRRFVGNGIRKLIERAVPAGTTVEQADAVFLAMKAYYDAHCLELTKPYEGVMELLQRLQEDGYRMAIVSNKLDEAVKELKEHFFSGYIPVAIGDREGIRRKPEPDSVYAALQALGSTPEEAIYIGDSEVDCETAKNAGMESILCLWGFRDRVWLEERGGTIFANDTGDLYRLIAER